MSKKITYDFAGESFHLVNELKLGGQIAIANETSFNAQFLSEPLTQYAVGWTSEQRELEKLLDFVAPQVNVSRKFQYKTANNAKEFLALEETEDIRALGGEFKRIEARGDIVQARTFNKGLATLIDLDEEDAEDGLEERKVAWLRKILLRMEIRRAIALLSSGATYTAKAGTSPYAGNDQKNWSKPATTSDTSGTASASTIAWSDPDMDLAAVLLSGGDSSGLDPNRILMGKKAWQARVLGLRSKDTAGAFASAGFTKEQLADFLACDEVFVNKERFQSGSSKANLVGDNLVLAFNAQAGMSKDDPSNIKRFVSSQEGGAFRVYRQELTSHLILISVSHYSNIVLTSDLGLRKLMVY